MYINEVKFKEKLIDELMYLNATRSLEWEKVSEDDSDDFMAIVKYAENPNRPKFITFAFRVCCYNNNPSIIIYDYLYKKNNSEAISTNLPSIEISDTDKNGRIYEILKSIKDKYLSIKESKDQELLNKLTFCLNKKK